LFGGRDQSAGFHRPLFTPLLRRDGRAKSWSCTGCTAGTATTATTATTLQSLQRPDVHRPLDHVANIPFLLKRRALAICNQRAAVHGRHRIHGLHRDVGADSITVFGKREPDWPICSARLKQAGQTKHNSKSGFLKSDRHHGSTNPDGLAVP
jgi:hypothetical protein